MLAYKKVFENNSDWVKEKSSKDSKYFETLSKGQNPDFLIIGCSDSRVPIEQIIKAEPGEVFIHRNIANIVSPGDTNLMAVIEYAVLHLKVKHIVVCGHTLCGGVAAALGTVENGDMKDWLKELKEVEAKYSDELTEVEKESEKARRLVEFNVLKQCKEVAGLKLVKDARKLGEYPQIHGWLFEMESGMLNDLEIRI